MDTRQAHRRKAAGQRVGKACLPCRSRKERCDGQHPCCGTCLTRGLACSYSSQQKKRGLREGWVHSLEKLLALVLNAAPEAEAHVISTLSNATKRDSNAFFAGRWSDESHRNGFLQQWRTSRLAKHLTALHDDLDRLARLKIPCPDDIAEEAERSADLPLSSTDIIPDVGSADLDLEGQQGDGTVPDAPVPSIPYAFRTTLVSLPANSLDLIEQYFQYTQSWLPVVSRYQIFRSYYSHRETGITAESHLPAALLLAVLHYTQLQDSSFSGSDFDRTSTVAEVGSDLYVTAKLLLDTHGDSLSLESAQAMIVMTLACLRRQHFIAASVMLAQASRIACLLQSSDKSIQSAADFERLPHVLRACFCLESALSAVLSMSPSCTAVKITSSHDITTDGLEEWLPVPPAFQLIASQPLSGPLLCLSTFNQLSHALEDLNAVRCAGTVVDGSSTIDPAIYLRTKSSLGTWNAIPSSGVTPVPPHMLTVRLIQVATAVLLESEIFLGTRPILQRQYGAVVDTLRGFALLFEGSVQSLLKPFVSPLWPLILSFIVQTLDDKLLFPAFGVPPAAWEAVLQIAGAVGRVDASPLVDSLTSRVQSCLLSLQSELQPAASTAFPAGIDLNNSTKTNRSDYGSGGADNVNLGMTHEATDETSRGILASAENNETTASFPAGTGGDVFSDVNSTTFDFIAVDAMQSGDTYNQGLQNLGFAADHIPPDLDDFFQSFQMPES